MIEINNAEYPLQVCQSYRIDANKIKENFLKIKTESFRPTYIMELGGPTILMNPYDLYILKLYLEGAGIKKVTELGCGSSSRLMDRLGIERTSFAHHDATECDTEFIKADLFESYDKILESCKQADLFFIDCRHSTEIAHCYAPMLKELDIPIFYHDWYLPGEQTFPEQNYWIEHLLDVDYTPHIITRVLSQKGYPVGTIPPCSVIFTKVK